MLEARLWKLTADYVKKRDGCCVTCGATEGLTISHWITARKQSVRYDLRNCNCQCHSCNNAHNYQHQFYDMYMLKRWGPEWMQVLTSSSSINGFKWTVLQLRDMVALREAQLEALGA